MRSIAWLLLAAVLSPLCASAADGDLDPAFGTGGIVEISWPAGSARANAVGLDHSGRLLVGGDAIGVYGNADFALFRLLPDGTLDTTYAPDGGGFRLIDFDLDGIGGNSNDTVNDLAVLGDGSVVSLGEAHFGFTGVNSQFALTRVDAGGSLDPGFGRNGSAHFGFGSFSNIDYGRLLLTDTQGRLLVLGMVAEPNAGGAGALDWWLGLARLTPSGQFDSSFYSGGSYATVFWVDPNIPPPRHSLDNFPLAFALDASARIVTAGIAQQPIPQDAAVYRAPADGGFDQGFGNFSRVQMGLSQGEASALLPLPTGLLLAGAYATGTNAYALFFARLHDDGSRDTGFGVNGIASIPLAQGYPEPSLIAATRDGGWLVAGRLTDPSFNGSGVVIARFDANGVPQTGFGSGGAVTLDIGDGRHFSAGRAVLQPDGKLVVAGSLPNSVTDTTPHFALMRILADHETIFADGFDGR